MAAVTVEAGDRAGGESGAPGTGADLGGEEPDSPTELCNTVTVGGAQAVRTEFSANAGRPSVAELPSCVPRRYPLFEWLLSGYAPRELCANRVWLDLER